MKKVIYIKYSPLTKKVYDDYCMGVLLDNGYQVEYWDVTSMFGIDLKSFESYTPQSPLVIVKISNYKDLNSKVLENKDALFISMMTCGIGQARMLRVLTRHHCKLAFWGPDPVFIPQKSIANKISGITLKKVKTKLGYALMRFLFKIRVLHYYDYYFSVGERGYRSLGVFDQSLLNRTKAVVVSSSDYNSYSRLNFEKTIKDNYIVFIDQYFPFHPDLLICGYSAIPADVYYDRLNRFFTSLEEKLQMRVVIAAHPKSLRYMDEDFFEGREVFFGITGPLIKNSSFVIAHDSTALSYAIMDKKPIALLTSKSIKKYMPEHNSYMKFFCNRFSIPLLDMDDMQTPPVKEFSTLTNTQQKLFESFIYEYCTSPQISTPNEQIVIDFVESLNMK